MNLPLVSQLPQDFTTVALLLLLIVIFVVAFKVMKMVFETVMVSGLSAGFYFGLTQLLGIQFSFNQMLTYAFMGASLYILYTFLASAYSTAKTFIKIPYSLAKIVVYPFKKLYSHLEERSKLKKLRKERKSSQSNTSEQTDTKKVVLDKVGKNDEDE